MSPVYCLPEYLTVSQTGSRPDTTPSVTTWNSSTYCDTLIKVKKTYDCSKKFSMIKKIF